MLNLFKLLIGLLSGKSYVLRLSAFSGLTTESDTANYKSKLLFLQF
ncbi:hypothetical protein SAMN05216556_12929 [Aequorivita viscosa]|uniref:Uncharacterized protein n=1 Tax=Aequorivita viscosa TaxID=797419 RepID=A0A1M6N502_9FLAO|nr:hypothetical protein SAMN05216556_12929 [Aequorivita viscosa]SHJ90825.1 hypothetical protein SAMN04487908_13128 [Aequorivita viscosa]